MLEVGICRPWVSEARFAGRSSNVPQPLFSEPSQRVHDGSLERGMALRQIEAIQVHYFVPRGNEVLHELLLRVGAAVNFRKGAQPRIGTKDEIDSRAGPLGLACFAVATV